MPAREASLKVTLQPAAFQAGLRRMTSMTKTAGRQIGMALKEPMVTGLKATRDEFNNMVGGMKSGIKTLATLGGAISVGAMVKDAMEMQNLYRNIAFNVNKVAGNTETWQSIQTMVQQEVENTGRTSEELAEAFQTVFEATGSLEYARKTMGIIGTTATAAGHSIGALGTAMQLASRKFNVGSGEAEEAMARFIEKTGVGGKGIEELTSRFALVAGEASNAGMQGAKGISELLGMLLLLDSSIGEKADPGLKMMFQTIKAGSSAFSRLKKEMGRKVKFDADMTALEKIKATLTTSKGRKAAEMIFTADARVVYDELAKPFDKAMEEAKAKGMKQSEAMKVALAAFDRNIQSASESSMQFAQIQDEATKRMKDDPSIKLNKAISRVKEAFAQPRMIEAVDKLADKLPVFADTVANVVDYILDNPWESLAMVVGGKLALAFGGSFIQMAVANGMKAIFARALAVQAASTAASVATQGATTLGVSGAVGAAGAAGGTGAALGAAAATGAAVLGAGAVGYGIGTLAYKYGGGEESINTEAAAMRRADEAVVKAGQVSKGGSANDIEHAIFELQQARVHMKNNESLLNTIAGGLAVFTGQADMSAGETREKKANELIAEEAKLRKALEALRAGADDASRSMKRFGSASSTRGPMMPADPNPGALPAGG